MTRLLRRKDDPVQHVPTLLVARANGHLSPADQLRLTQLLEKSPQARDVQTAFRRAEEAYRDESTPPVSPGGNNFKPFCFSFNRGNLFFGFDYKITAFIRTQMRL